MQITIRKNKYDVDKTSDGIIINGEKFEADISEISPRKYQVFHKEQSFTIEIVDESAEEKSYRIKLNGKKTDVSVKDPLDVLLEKLGIDSSASAKLKDMKAPMPGLILEIKVKEGDMVKKGDQLLVLEAMKMENVIKSPGEGTIKKVLVNKGESVEKNHVLIEF